MKNAGMNAEAGISTDTDHVAGSERIKRSGRPTTVAMILVVSFAAFLFGAPTRHGEFLSGDDERLILEQMYVNHPSLSHAWDLLTIVHGDLYQPIPMLTFQANYAMTETTDLAERFRVNPYAFHLTNIILHAINACLAFLVAARLARCRWIALLVGVMFACHPFAMEAVAWINGRMILLATTFALLVILSCLHRREDGRGAWVWLAGLSWILVLASKVLPSVPIAAALCDYHRNGRLPRRCFTTYMVLLLLGGAATWFAMQSSSMSELVENTQTESSTTAPVRLLLAGRYHLENYFCPTRLSAWSPPVRGVSFLSYDVAIALAECAGLLVLMGIAWRRNRTAFVGLCLFILLLSPYLAATLGRRILTADRYMYFPILGLHLALAAVGLQCFNSLQRRISMIAAGVVALAMLTCWMTLGHRIAPTWENTIQRAERGVAVYPDNPDAQVELAKAYVWSRNATGALRVVAAARKIWPDNPRLAAEAGKAYRILEDWPRAEVELRLAVRGMPQHTPTRYYHALAMQDMGETEASRASLRAILSVDPGFVPAATTLARSYRSTGEVNAAIEAYEQALHANPYHRDCYFELAELMIGRQDWDRAQSLLEHLIEFQPDHRPAIMNLGVVFAKQGRLEDAIELYDHLLAIAPTAIAVRVNRANLLVSLTRSAEAEEEYRRILTERPSHRAAAIGLHELLQQQKRFSELVKLWHSFPASPDSPNDASGWLAWAYVLSGDVASARNIASSLNANSESHDFAVWTLAFHALRTHNIIEFQKLLMGLSATTQTTPTRHEQGRALLRALSEMSQAERETPAGIYALCRISLFMGDFSTTKNAAMWLLREPTAERWHTAAREILNALERSGDEQPM